MAVNLYAEFKIKSHSSSIEFYGKSEFLDRNQQRKHVEFVMIIVTYIAQKYIWHMFSESAL